MSRPTAADDVTRLVDQTRPTTLPPGIAAGLASATEITATHAGAGTPRRRSHRVLAPAVVESLERLQTSLMKSDGQPRFSPVTVLGEGSQGVVYRVADRDCRREVAFKLLAGDNASAEDVQRFVLEAQITAQLEHPGIVPVHDLGVLRDGTLYYSMKCVEGESLADHLGPRAGRAEHRFALLEIFLHICQTIAFAHSRGVIHRDIKPRNIMVGTFGEVLLMDWGLAKIIGSEDGSRAVRSDLLPNSDDAYRTMIGTAVGTPAYMAPEQASGATSTLDHRCDIYALGVLLYEMLCAISPYERGDVNRVLRQARDGEWTRLDRRRRDLPRPLVAIVHLAMTCDRELRYQTVDSLARDVRAFLTGDAVVAYRESPAERLGRTLRRHRSQVRVGIGVALIALSLAVTVWVVMAGRQRATVESLRREAQDAEFASNFVASLSATQRLMVWSPEDSWASRARVRLEQAIAKQAQDEMRRQTEARRTEANRAKAMELIETARRAEAVGGEYAVKEATEHYMAAFGLAPQDESIRHAYQSAYDRLVAYRRDSETNERNRDQERGAGYYVEAARRAFTFGARFVKQGSDRRAEAARVRALPTYGSDPRVADRLGLVEDAAEGSEKRASMQNALGLASLETALHLEGQNREAKRLMADWCIHQLELAEAREDEAEAVALMAKASQYDSEQRYSERLIGLARVSLPSGAAAVTCQSLIEAGDRVLRPDQRTERITPGASVPLMRGRWLATSADGTALAFRLNRGDRRELRLPSAPPTLPPGIAYLPGGSVLDHSGRAVAEIGRVGMAQREVTCGEWLAFLSDPAVRATIASEARAGRTVRMPRSAVDQRTPLWRRGPGDALVELDGREIDREVPVTGISANDAEAYTRWRALRDGVPWRLPTRDEWRFAMQGGDGRPFPWGLRFDPDIVLADCTDEDGAPRLTPGGQHPRDVSVQGVLDLAGSVSELTVASHGRVPMLYLVCGGSFRDRRDDAFTSTAFRPETADAIHPGTGFRLVLTLP